MLIRAIGSTLNLRLLTDLGNASIGPLVDRKP